MQKLTQFLLVTSFLFALLLTACNNEAKPAPEVTAGNNVLERPTPPPDYTNLKSPTLSSSDLDRGKQLYLMNCMTCHGENGLGDGPAAASLNPKPQPLAMNEKSLSDAYLYWRISEGGQMEQFKSAMPAWNSILDDDEIWKIIGYLRKLGG